VWNRFAIGLLSVGFAWAALELLDHAFPPPLELATQGLSQVVLAQDGQPLRAFADSRGVWRYPVSVQSVAPNYLATLVSYEDRWFYHHAGINPLALLRASFQLLRSGRVISGGSTLSMQVARLIEPIGRGIPGKLKQMLRAVQLERRLSKREILQIYVNRAPFGGTIEGVQTAAYAYLGRGARQLSDAEAALLTVIPQSPSRLRPDRSPERAQAARNKVLKRVARIQNWPDKRLQSAYAESVASSRLRDPMLAALLAERLKRTDSSPVIHTLIDRQLQQRLEQRVASYIARFPAGTSAAVAVVENRNMATLAYVGSARFSDPARFGHIDMLSAWRSPGSTLKPFLYGLAIERGLIHSASLLMDVPTDFNGYRPGNFEAGFRGPVSASDALTRSLNIPAVDLLDRLSPEFFSGRLSNAGIQLKSPAGSRPNLSLILGGTGIQLEQLISAFAALSRGGLMAPMRLRPQDRLSERRLLDADAALVVRRMLIEAPRPGLNLSQVDTAGGRRLAWKTGTSYGYRDALALGTNSAVTVGVWIGRPDGTPIPGEFGAHSALPLLFEIADSLAGRALDEPKADGVQALDFCWPLGLPSDSTPPNWCARRVQGYAIRGLRPPTLKDRESSMAELNPLPIQLNARAERLTPACGSGTTHWIARWPKLAGPWLAPAERKLAAIPAYARNCHGPSDGSIRIIGIQNGTTLARAPSRAILQVQLQANGATEEVQWLDNERLIGRTRAGAGLLYTLMEAGPHRIVALEESGVFDAVEFTVAF